MKTIRLRVTLFPETVNANTLRSRNMLGEYEITLDETEGRAEIVNANAPRCDRDTSAMLGSLVKLDVEAMP